MYSLGIAVRTLYNAYIGVLFVNEPLGNTYKESLQPCHNGRDEQPENF